jgi:hypothetical protein
LPLLPLRVLSCRKSITLKMEAGVGCAVVGWWHEATVTAQRGEHNLRCAPAHAAAGGTGNAPLKIVPVSSSKRELCGLALDFKVHRCPRVIHADHNAPFVRALPNKVRSVALRCVDGRVDAAGIPERRRQCGCHCCASNPQKRTVQ